MTELQFKTNVKIDHEFYKLQLLDHNEYEFTYQGRFRETPEHINNIIKSDICLGVMSRMEFSREVNYTFSWPREWPRTAKAAFEFYGDHLKESFNLE